jgi:hypothetical protein
VYTAFALQTATCFAPATPLRMPTAATRASPRVGSRVTQSSGKKRHQGRRFLSSGRDGLFDYCRRKVTGEGEAKQAQWGVAEWVGTAGLDRPG